MAKERIRMQTKATVDIEVQFIFGGLRILLKFKQFEQFNEKYCLLVCYYCYLYGRYKNRSVIVYL